ncbi:MAG: hypothetical protein CMP12_00155 [Zunongwangia sp.]|uniref:Membrane protein n=2 Tax=Zunongwangia profunda TaxID=398743 RepID=D5B9U3_ZUNPS|nr:hypothetical protein [Zunongwangia profunda]MAG86944.1 hypothetical protein [Flavobacteriaceae bacterium]MAO34324.1 hypothetical protein [Zunongwangia sp.]ADF52241.1 membrane protein [Zunongwangia profunda SM-A87]MAS71006.1 hypothetical protein [Zunongwangia sp.]HAJ81447.1 hypothetical protein [Zunongwangia profunda]|tara:strand:- start:4981 stop:5262 length:282 start_codon:yes stop_codon:yes gene_type:complete
MTLYAKLNEEFSHNFLGYSALAMIVSTSLGGIAIMTTLMHGHAALQMFMVFISVAICSAHNASILTVQKPSVVFHLFTASVLINTLLIIGNSI